VFLGHTVFLSAYGASIESSDSIQFIHTGAFAVDFFFC
jgi:hypothetical protein